MRKVSAGGIFCHALAFEFGAEARLTGMLGPGRIPMIRGSRHLPEVMGGVHAWRRG